MLKSMKEVIQTLVIILVIAVGSLIYFKGDKVDQIVDSQIDKFVSQTNEVQTLTSKVSELESSLGQQLFERIKKIKNPTMEGIEVLTRDGVTLIFPKSYIGTEHEVFVELMYLFAKDADLDFILFGGIYSGLDGVSLWVDETRNNETDLELLITSIRKRNLKSGYGFINNPEERFLPAPFKETVYGDLHYEISKEFIAWPISIGHKLEIHAKNLHGTISSTGMWKFQTHEMVESGISIKLGEMMKKYFIKD